VGTLRVQGSGEIARDGGVQTGLFCTRILGEDPMQQCGFVFSSGIGSLPRKRVVLLGPSSEQGLCWGATLCRGPVQESAASEIDFHFIVTPRADQLNACQIDLPGKPFDEGVMRKHETPMAVRGFRNNVPLVMTFSERQRLRRRQFLITLSNWGWERSLWRNSKREIQDRKTHCPIPEGYLLPLDLEEDLERQLDAVDELQALQTSRNNRVGKSRTSSPVCVVVIGSKKISLDFQKQVQNRLAILFSYPIGWFSSGTFHVRALGMGDSIGRMAAADLSQPLNWILSDQSKNLHRL